MDAMDEVGWPLHPARTRAPFAPAVIRVDTFFAGSGLPGIAGGPAPIRDRLSMQLAQSRARSSLKTRA